MGQSDWNLLTAMRFLIAISLFALALGQVIEPRQVIQPRNTCGTIPSFLSGDRIVGGQDAAAPIPWQVSVRQCQSGGCHFCGGTILDEKTVMCAAHCFTTGQSMNGYYITAGVTDRNDGSGQTIEIANGVWNSAMPYSGNNNDFIILKLSSALSFNENVGPACLPEPGFAPDSTGETCVVSGWGTLNSGANSLPTNLQWVAVPTVTNAQCAQAYGSTITSSMICAGLPEGGKDSCQGDSGGPFVCRKDGKAVLTGVVSFGIGCALADYPGVYARVTAVLDWVKANMPQQLHPHHLDVVLHNGPQMNGVMMKTTMLIAIMMEVLAVPILSEDGIPTALIVNARIQIMLRTVLTFGQPRNAKGGRTKEDVTDNGSKKIVK